MCAWGWQWVAPDNWPPAPDDWAPYPGWQPDPKWPAPRPGHRFWRRRKRSWLAVSLIVAGCVATAVILVSAMTAVSSLAPCAFDPPPGDVASMTLTNDLTRVVTFEGCMDSQCTRRDDRTSSGLVSAGTGVDWNHELCSEDPVGVVDSSGQLLGCVVLPAQDPAKITHFYASAAVPCH